MKTFKYRFLIIMSLIATILHYSAYCSAYSTNTFSWSPASTITNSAVQLDNTSNSLNLESRFSNTYGSKLNANFIFT